MLFPDSDPKALHKAGAETVTGAKTFTALPVLSGLDGFLRASGGSLTAAAIVAGDLPNTTVTAGTYMSANIIVDAQGRITSAANGSGGSGLTIGDAVFGGGVNRVLFEDASQALSANSGFTFTTGGGLNLTGPITVGTTATITGSAVVSGGIDLTGTTSGAYDAELRFSNAFTSNHAFTTVSTTGFARMYFDHRGLSNTGSWYWRNGTGAANTQMSLDGSTGNLTVAGGLILGGLLSLSDSLFVTGSISAAYYSEIQLGNASGQNSALTTGGGGTPRMMFDHRGSGNTGEWYWRNGTNAANSQMTLSSAGLLQTVGGILPATTYGAPGAAGTPGELRGDPTNSKIWMYTASGWKSVLLS